MSSPIKISASRVKLLKDCSMQFYLQEIEKLPQRKWTRTAHGVIIHSIFEQIMDKTKSKRRKWLELIILNGFKMTDYPVIERYIKLFNTNKETLEPYNMGDMEIMIDTAFLGVRKYFLDTSGKKFVLPEYSNEERFEIDMGGWIASGFIDILIKLPNGKYYIGDLKSQKSKFKKSELSSNIQALMYQLAVLEKYKCQSHVEFILLRFPPTERTPDLHIQITPQATPAQLRGLKIYLGNLYQRVNNSFGLREAISAPHKDKYFCKNVCSYFNSFRYKSLRKKSDNSLVANFPLDAEPEIGQDQVLEVREFKGCPVAIRD